MSFHSGFVAIIGRPNVGKSTLMNALVGEKVAIVSDKPQTTRNRIMGVASGDGWQIVFLDTPGLHTPRTKLGEYMVRAANEALDGIDALLVMVDGAACGAQDKQIIARMAQMKVPKLLAVNKIDLLGPQKLAPLLASLDVTEDMITDQPERVLCGEIIREKALRNLRDEVPHGVGVEMQRIEKISDTLTEIHATLYCERESHKRIIIGKQGAMLGKIGSQAREEIERLLGTHVALKLWVKVREDWRNRKEDLRTLGYE